MGKINAYFFDTYAFYEIISRNPNYKTYIKQTGIITTKLNLMELHYGLILKHGKEHADEVYDWFLQFVVDIDDKIIKDANCFRVQFKKRNLSYVDCIGYVTAKSRGVKFLTGDKQFEDLENVGYVK